MRGWLKEPLLHFLVAGGVLFVAYAWRHPGAEKEPRVVHVTAGDVRWLREAWGRQRQRPPDEQELRGLVVNYVKEVLLAREARELGMDEDDTVVRRRLAQKMEFLVQDTARLAEPEEAELRRLYAASGTRYESPARVSFAQLYFTTEAAARQSLQAIATRGATGLGERSLLEREYDQADQQTVANLFGHGFADTIFTLTPGAWHGPIASSYGFHLVRVHGRQDARQRPFEEVRVQVLEEWRRSQHTKAQERFFAELLKRYDVVVEDDVARLIGLLAEAVR